MYKSNTDITKGKNSSTVIVGDFNTPISIMYTTSRRKVNREIKDVNNAINQLDLADTYIKLHLL